MQYMKTIFIHLLKSTASPILCPTFWGQCIDIVFTLILSFLFETAPFYILKLSIISNFFETIPLILYIQIFFEVMLQLIFLYCILLHFHRLILNHEFCIFDFFR